ncbi:ABC transporter permease [Cellulosilyticum ruminicola]|uniref:ABC transporter permease n=1 Tax=Cellulosilyticum ruminicola TaxID=425254 RepID=UPI001FA6FBA5|nr:ABC-2 family transporter protein [Cellulosilyticum ruminicola]
MKKYLALTKVGILEKLNFRGSIYINLIGNLIYLIVTYYLWKAVYMSVETGTVNGMSFYDTMIYLVLAATISMIMGSRVVWWMGMDYQSGQVGIDLLKPMNYLVYWFFFESGEYIVSIITLFIPTFCIVYVLTKGMIVLGVNIIFFVISLILSILINYFIDFIVGILCFYTQSIWGINIMKEVVVALLSGARIPLVFFPVVLRNLCKYLPFQYIYNTPLTIILSHNCKLTEYMHLLLIQIVWVIITGILAALVWKNSKKLITVNGG